MTKKILERQDFPNKAPLICESLEADSSQKQEYVRLKMWNSSQCIQNRYG
jgi:hypothetical protein